MNEIDDESLDVESIVVLICHNHQMAITESLDVRFVIFDVELEPQNIDDVLNFFIFGDLCILKVRRNCKMILQRQRIKRIKNVLMMTYRG